MCYPPSYRKSALSDTGQNTTSASPDDVSYLDEFFLFLEVFFVVLAVIMTVICISGLLYAACFAKQDEDVAVSDMEGEEEEKQQQPRAPIPSSLGMMTAADDPPFFNLDIMENDNDAL